MCYLLSILGEVAGHCFGDLVEDELQVVGARGGSADPSEAGVRPDESNHDDGGLLPSTRGSTRTL
eukprot:4861-Pyramimonas_sp.AAC.1